MRRRRLAAARSLFEMPRSLRSVFVPVVPKHCAVSDVPRVGKLRLLAIALRAAAAASSARLSC